MPKKAGQQDYEDLDSRRLQRDYSVSFISGAVSRFDSRTAWSSVTSSSATSVRSKPSQWPHGPWAPPPPPARSRSEAAQTRARRPASLQRCIAGMASKRLQMKLHAAPPVPMTNRDLPSVRQRHQGREAGCGGRHQGRLAAEMPNLLVADSAQRRLRQLLQVVPAAMKLILADQRAVLMQPLWFFVVVARNGQGPWNPCRGLVWVAGHLERGRSCFQMRLCVFLCVCV